MSQTPTYRLVVVRLDGTNVETLHVTKLLADAAYDHAVAQTQTDFAAVERIDVVNLKPAMVRLSQWHRDHPL